MGSERVQPYTAESFQRQARLLRKGLSDLGIEASSDDATRVSFLSRRKYDRYDHFLPGETFDNRLLKWLGVNFTKDERSTAFEIVRALRFISSYEMKELAIKTFEKAKSIVIRNATEMSSSNWYNYLESRELKLRTEITKSIFVAFADDVSFDFFRRFANREFPFRKENFVEYYKIDGSSLEELPDYNRIFLIDQLSASCTTAIRKENGIWKGKIPKFHAIWKDYTKDIQVYYCPYILSSVSDVLSKKWVTLSCRCESVTVWSGIGVS